MAEVPTRDGHVGGTRPGPHTDLHLPEGVEELVVPVGQHVQLVANVLLGEFLGLGCAGLVAGGQLDIDLHILTNTRTDDQSPEVKHLKPNKRNSYELLTTLSPSKILVDFQKSVIVKMFVNPKTNSRAT